jgi:two-component system sensor histidine kinase BaeS
VAAKLDPGAGPEALAAALRDGLSDLPVRAEYLVVTDAAGGLLYATHFGTVAGPGLNLLRKVQESGDWHDTPAAAPRFRFAAKALPFDADESNRLFFAALEVTALWAGALAVAAAALLALLLSRPQSRDARRLAEALRAMEAGRRDVALPDPGVRELQDIARGAAALQDSLLREEGLRRQWAADIAHDLRTPVTVLKGQFEGMIDGVFRPDAERLEKNYREVLRLERLIAQLAELTRLESPGFRPELRVFDPAPLVAELAARFADAAAARGGRVAAVSRLAPDAWPAGDPALLERALANLLDNAIRHGDRGGTVQVEAAAGVDGQLVFTVENPGAIPEEWLPRLFDRLFRGDESRASGGSGLGLAIAKAIASAHHGRLEAAVDRAAGRTRFLLAIPAAESSPDLHPASAEPAP